MKKYVLILLSLSLSVALYFSLQPIEQYVTKQTLQKIKQLSHQHSIQIRWDSIRWSPSNLSIQFSNVQIQTKNSSATPIHLKQLKVSLAIFPSLLKQSLLLNAEINGFQHPFYLDSSQLTAKNSFVFNHAIPIYQIVFKNTLLKINTPYQPVLLDQVYLKIINKNNYFYVKLNTKTYTKDESFFIKSQFQLNNQQINIAQLELTKSNSSIQLSGWAKTLPDQSLQSMELNIKSSFLWKKLQSLLNLWGDQYALPLSGVFKKMNAHISYNTLSGWNVKFQTEVKDLIWKHIPIDQLTARGALKNNTLRFDVLHLENQKGWTVFSENSTLQLNKKKIFSFTAYARIKNFQTIESLLPESIGLQWSGPAKIDCKGQWTDWRFHCSTKGDAHHFSYTYPDQTTAILKIPKLQFRARWIKGSKKSIITGQISSPNKSSASFQISKPFRKIQFKGDLNLNDITSIYDLPVHGKTTALNGVLSLDPFYLKSNLTTQNLAIQHIKIGNATTDLDIQPDYLSFNKIKGSFKDSQYQGDIKILFSLKPKIQVQSQLNPLKLEDLSDSLQKVFSLPIDISGFGQASVAMDSWLDWSQLSYQLNSKFTNLSLRKEFFQHLTLNLTSKNGLFTINKAMAQKTKGTIQVTGSISSSEKINLHVNGSNLLLEQIESIKPYINSYLTGLAQLSIKIKGVIQKPIIQLQSKIEKIFYGNQPIQNGKIQLEWSDSQLTGEMFFDNKKLQLLKIQKNQNKKLSFFVKADQFNIIPFLRYFSPSDNVQSVVTANAYIDINHYNWNRLSGYLNIQDIYFQKGTQKLQSSHPFFISLDKGLFSFKKPSIQFQHNQQLLTLQKYQSKQFLLSGSIPLDFASLLIPFVSNSSGIIQLQLKVNHQLSQLSPSGSFYVKDGSIRLSKFVDTLQSVQLDGSLQSKKLNLQNFSAKTLIGDIQGSGWIDYSSSKKTPLHINTSFNNIEWNIDRHIQLKNSGKLKLAGENKPYTLTGNLQITEGYAKSDFQKTNQLDDLEWLPNYQVKPLFSLNVSANFDHPFAVENEVISALLTGSLKLTGEIQSPIAMGVLNFLPGGVFRFREYDFKILSGYITYQNKPLSKPYFDFIAETDFEEIRSNTQQIINHKITANMMGDSSDFQLKLSSPHLSEANILSMMALGASSVGFEANQLSDAAQYSYSQIGSALFQDTIGKGLKNWLGARFLIIPSFDSDPASTKIVAKKKWSKNFSTSAITSITAFDHLKLEYQLSPYLSLLGIWKDKNQQEESLTDQENQTLNFEIEYKLDF